MEFDKQSVLNLIKEQGGNDEQAAQQLPDKIDHNDHAGLLQKFGIDPNDLISKLGGTSHLGR
jgi:hypothetical protein